MELNLNSASADIASFVLNGEWAILGKGHSNNHSWLYTSYFVKFSSYAAFPRFCCEVPTPYSAECVCHQIPVCRNTNQDKDDPQHFTASFKYSLFSLQFLFFKGPMGSRRTMKGSCIHIRWMIVTVFRVKILRKQGTII